jgi:hypothetical protein
VDPIRVSQSPDPLPRGPSVFLPFEGFNARVVAGKGIAEFKLALDLPPMRTIHHARIYMMNNPALARRIIEYREFAEKEITSSPKFMQYMGLHKGAL